MASSSDKRVLVTGGAGFIGSHLVDRLIADGRSVRVLDSLEPQVHGEGEGHRNEGADYLIGTILDREAVRAALDGVTSVVHLAAQVGVGQSMYEMARYVQENCTGTAVFLEELQNQREQIDSLVVASSMSIYGEGAYECTGCGISDPEVERPLDSLKAREWEPRCVECGAEVKPIPTPERKHLRSDSVYAATKRDHEELSLIFGRAYDVRTVALRFFNVYGPRQSLSNPYTGVAAIFLSRLLNDSPPMIFEDGKQSRDFIHVSDIVEAIRLSLDTEGVGNVALNVGTGRPTTVLDVSDALQRELGKQLEPEIVGKFRQGDIRHCIGDISKARELLGYEPKVGFEDGMAELVRWTLENSPEAEDRVSRSSDELSEHGLVI